ncbi:MAG: hypothetical protein WCQ97_05690 [Aminobacterium sp.]|nr:hypothetical protein [Aminobacterium sp.]MDD3425722.1 hypothetical protein [Aminobacterium sp.]MDD3707679.1 hypothetical protein [Aminobacterium sp.]MDD4228909.1 hypothetical protein [Aminobacterium sp.]MDD4551851.1 hypothetical protein [Aminobacterium sp.]
MKRLLLLLSLLMGIVYCIETNFLLLSAKHIKLELPGPYSEQVFWSHFNSDNLRFFPVVFFSRDEVIEKIEREIPVYFNINMHSLKEIHVSARPLNVWIVLVQKGTHWYLSEDGRIWDGKSVASNFIYGDLVQAGVPVWHLNENFPIPIDGIEEKGRSVFRSALPLDSLKQWVDEIEKNSWGAPINKVKFGRKAGSYSFVIEVKWKKRLVSILLDEDTQRWPIISRALPKVMKDLPEGNEMVEIDTTYGDKIVVRTL